MLVLDQITDPHNVGAIVRSCAAFGVDAVVTTARHSPAATGVLAKSASGGLEHVPFLTVRNLAEALIALGERGFPRIGLDSDGRAELGDVAVRRPLALVLGAEGKGLRQRTRDCCDVVARLDMPGAIKSLNVSNAAAVALYAVATRARAPALTASGPGGLDDRADAGPRLGRERGDGPRREDALRLRPVRAPTAHGDGAVRSRLNGGRRGRDRDGEDEIRGTGSRRPPAADAPGLGADIRPEAAIDPAALTRPRRSRDASRRR